jgi:polyhydroxyalkanoate synthase subunit PhaC
MTDAALTDAVQAELEDLRQRSIDLWSALEEVSTVTIGTAPKDAVYARDKLTLYRYQPPPGKPHGSTAVLICYALVNRPYMMDLQPDRSLIRGLLQQGVDVFLIDWGQPDGSDRYLGLDDYVNDYLDACVAQVCKLRSEKQVNLLGVCQGGVLSLCYTALHPQRVRKLITMVTPVDFKTPDDLLSKWVQPVDVPALVAAHGNVPGAWLNAAFISLMPFRLLSQKYVDLLYAAKDRTKLENFMRMEKWIFDSPDLPGVLFSEFVTQLYQQNQLINDELMIGDQTVRLSNISQPLFNIFATQDHLVPPAASQCLSRLTRSTQYQELAFAAGHIGIYVSSKAQQQIPAALAQWLRERAT